MDKAARLNKLRPEILASKISENDLNSFMAKYVCKPETGIYI